MPVTVTVDPNFIYGMLKEYNDAVKAKNIGGTALSSSYLSFIYVGVERYQASLSGCSVAAVTGGAKITCSYYDSSTNKYGVDTVAYRFMVGSSEYELFSVSFSGVIKYETDTITITATAELKVG